ncbi:fasciclin domain-containing protein [Altererythrobacter sp. ZODW24]|uniref:fasciclin domain-containing protein n=1 Tax=Altererythrobacter sp. ZODW24 TaxID=2185142 RepID=UPI000DF7A4C2|nr:fasciclin domain-containing protein [Altererythrobacter sp. ZODW24]
MSKTFSRAIVAASAALALGACSTVVPSSGTSTAAAPMMSKNNTIAENVQISATHTTMEKAVIAADLVSTLSSPGPFTVFAPTDSAFSAVPEASLNMLLQPSNKQALQKVLYYHVVAGKVSAKDLSAKIAAGGGKAMLNTIAGEQLTATISGGNVMIMGKNGSMGTVTRADVGQSNGVMHVTDGVLLPTM